MCMYSIFIRTYKEQLRCLHLKFQGCILSAFSINIIIMRNTDLIRISYLPSLGKKCFMRKFQVRRHVE